MYACVCVCVVFFRGFENSGFVLLIWWKEDRHLHKLFVCLFVFLSLEVLLLLLLLQILENVYQPFWFDGGMACSHLGGRKL
jgi:hypothetical protein